MTKLGSAGTTVKLTLEFERSASDDADDYDMSIDFGSGLQAVL